MAQLNQDIEQLNYENGLLTQQVMTLSTQVEDQKVIIEDYEVSINKAVQARPYTPAPITLDISYAEFTTTRKTSLQLLYKDEGEGFYSWYLTCGISEPTSYDAIWDLGNTYLSGKYQLRTCAPLVLSHAGKTNNWNQTWAQGVATSLYLHYSTDHTFIYIPYGITFSSSSYKINVFMIKYSGSVTKTTIDYTELPSYTFPALCST